MRAGNSLWGKGPAASVIGVYQTHCKQFWEKSQGVFVPRVCAELYTYSYL
jgi:hypothetical protein